MPVGIIINASINASMKTFLIPAEDSKIPPGRIINASREDTDTETLLYICTSSCIHSFQIDTPHTTWFFKSKIGC